MTHSHSQRRSQFEGDAYEAVPNMVFGTDTGHAEGWWPVYGFPEPAPDFSNSPMFQLPVIPCENAYKELVGGSAGGEDVALPAGQLLPGLSQCRSQGSTSHSRAGSHPPPPNSASPKGRSERRKRRRRSRLTVSSDSC